MKASILNAYFIAFLEFRIIIVHNEEKAHFNMLEQQVRPTDITDPSVLAALKQIKRTDFVDSQWPDSGR